MDDESVLSGGDAAEVRGGVEWLRSYEVAKLRSCEVTKLRSYEVAKLRSYEVAKLRSNPTYLAPS